METFDAPKKKCTYCGEHIEIDASRCPYCASLLDIKVDSPMANTDFNYHLHTDTIESIFEDSSLNPNDHNSDSRINEATKATYEERSSSSNNYSSTVSKNINEKITHDPQVKQTPAVSINSGIRKPLGNGFKVFLTVICTIIPGFGQLIGIIAGISFMSSDDEEFGADKRSFGLALLVASLIMFVLSSIFWFIVLLAIAVPFN